MTRGRALIVDGFNPHLPAGTLAYEGGGVNFGWWSFRFEPLQRMIADAGFSRVECVNTFTLHGADPSEPRAIQHAAFAANAITQPQ